VGPTSGLDPMKPKLNKNLLGRLVQVYLDQGFLNFGKNNNKVHFNLMQAIKISRVMTPINTISIGNYRLRRSIGRIFKKLIV
jgi:hypothetical protein